MFRHGIHTSGVFSAPGMTPDRQKIFSEELNRVRGVDQAGRHIILPGVVSWVKMGMTMEEAQILGTKELLLTDMARIFRIPPHMLADLSRATYSNIEEQAREFLDYTISYWTVGWTQRLAKAVLTPSERKRGYFFRFDSDALRQANFAQRYAGYQSSIQSGWQTRNEVRAKEGLPALDGLDEPLRPLNMAPEGVLMEKEAEPEPDPTPVP